MKTVSDKNCRKSQNALQCSITLFRKLFRLWDNVEKYGRPGQAADENTAHALLYAA